MYSFSPLIDHSQTHYGFWFILIFISIILLLNFIDIISSFKNFIIAILLTSLILGIFYISSYGDKPPKNIKTVAKFISFQPEGYRESMGKSRVDKHYMYAVFKVDNKNIIMQINESTAYPEYVILYKN